MYNVYTMKNAVNSMFIYVLYVVYKVVFVACTNPRTVQFFTYKSYDFPFRGFIRLTRTPKIVLNCFVKVLFATD